MKWMTFFYILFSAKLALAHTEGVGAPAPNHLLDGSSSVSFRLFSATDPSRCLIDFKPLGDRHVVKWSNQCADKNGIFVYEDGGGFEAFLTPNGEYASFTIRPDLPKKTTPLEAKNLFFSNTVTQDEFTNSLSVTLFLQPDGTFIIGDYDDEEPTPMKMCVSEKDGSVPAAMSAAEIVAATQDKKVCARLTLKKI